MFPDAYFAPRYFAPRYFPRPVVPDTGGGGVPWWWRIPAHGMPDDDDEVLAWYTLEEL